jgi:pyruvate,orthophosphate dikinase
MLEQVKQDLGVQLDTELEASAWRALTHDFKALVEQMSGKAFPQDVRQQLWGAVGAVFDSWNSDRARIYRRLNAIPHHWGTAVNVQAMVFGNMGDTSATGVAFTRNPSTGEPAYYGEYLINAQGEDVVAGIRTPRHLTRAAREAAGAELVSLEEAMPSVFAELVRVFSILEAHYRDMQDIEFTIERGKLWMLQTRSGKRTAAAALRIAVEMQREGLIDEKEAVSRIDPAALDQLIHPSLDPSVRRTVIAKGLPASPGAASGRVIFDADTAEQLAAVGEKVILVRVETSPEDIHGMHAAEGILTARGGMTSHAAVVARGMGRPCVAGAGGIQVDYAAKTMRAGPVEVRESEVITIDGSSGEVMLGEIPTVRPEMTEEFRTLMRWADGYRRMRVRANAETPADCRAAIEFGAEGIGLCRTEHMFFDAERIACVREMILARDEPSRRSALARLLPHQRGDFEEIFEIMAGLPVTIRLLDPPLHEFLPHKEEEFAEVARAAGVSIACLKRRAEELCEANPMLGHRGCRLGISYPEIYEMQSRAIFEAAVAVAKRAGTAPILEIMVPLVATRAELKIIRELIERTASMVFREQDAAVDYVVGTMIELPRAALCADSIAEEAQFFSFGTNDLTQTALGLSRDDAGQFLPLYVERDILAQDPFASLDERGVGELVRLAVERGRATRPGIKLGICGEHGGDPTSIHFFESVGLDYVSASAFRVPIARLAAAQAAIRGTSNLRELRQD